ncbi:Domain of unknown function DB domain-containing protein [Strongyloides ratti]|uniref:DB domain-containing protein n=1 Tax=Strongyloides ratti TaxID=34506 RepID=A0A090KWS8_STRRB|nr:Domain of unknown function DB domain-containing protein [Strongyloides ratti]CEF60317.1 Domain of unknown function DB domain-containing protein [Strongyloides ratti]
MLVLSFFIFYLLNLNLNCQIVLPVNENKLEDSNAFFLDENNKKDGKIFLTKNEKKKKLLKIFNNNSNIIPDDIIKSYNSNQFIIYAPIKGKKIFTRIKYDSVASFVKKSKTRTATKSYKIENKKLSKNKSNYQNINRLVENNKMSKSNEFDNNELEYLTKSKGVIPIPNRPKIIEEEKIFLNNKIINNTKRVTLKKKKLFGYYNEITTTTIKLPTKLVTKITSLSIFNDKKQLNSRRILTADETLLECCIKRKISLDCKQICSFKEISDKTLVQAVLTNKCPNGELKEVFECANNGDDHTKCCYDHNVHLINNGQCMAFCSKTSTPITDILQYFICLEV